MAVSICGKGGKRVPADHTILRVKISKVAQREESQSKRNSDFYFKILYYAHIEYIANEPAGLSSFGKP